jgi:sec-independent protein translocase protein TatB
MFDIGWSELLLIGVVALIVIGPKELPGALRTLGQWTGKLRRMAAEFQGQFQEAMREAEMVDLKKQVDDLTMQAQGYASLDPLAEVRKEVESTRHQIEASMTGEGAAAPSPDAARSAAAEAPALAEPPLQPGAEGSGGAAAAVPAETSADAGARPGEGRPA